MGIKRLEDLGVWQEARKLVREVYILTKDEEFSKDWALRDQVRRAAISIMANIAEGFGRRSNREFMLFLNYASGSAVELKSHFYLALDIEYVTKGEFDKIIEILDSTAKQINGFRKYLKKSER